MTITPQYFYLDELRSLGPCEVLRLGEKFVTFRRPDGSTLEMEITRLSWATQEQLQSSFEILAKLKQKELSEVTND